MPQFMRPMLTLTITATSSMYESSIHWYPHLTSSNIEVKTVCISHNFPWYTVSAHTAIILNLILCAYVAQSPRRAVWGPRCGYNTRAWAERACDMWHSQLSVLLLWSSGKGQARKGKGWPLRWKASKLKLLRPCLELTLKLVATTTTTHPPGSLNTLA